MVEEYKEGTIKFYDPTNEEGLLECSDSSYYEFNSEALEDAQFHSKLKRNKKVKFKPVIILGFYLADAIRDAN